MIKKTSTKKTAPAKKAVKKEVPAKKAAPVKKVVPVKKAAENTISTKQTTIVANIDVGFGNTLHIRGEGAGLSWDKGIPLENISPFEWKLTAKKTAGTITFKFLINDELWAEGENLSVKAGSHFVHSPIFIW